eukprot:3089455-Karenia_brevis.AAC.1
MANANITWRKSVVGQKASVCTWGGWSVAARGVEVHQHSLVDWGNHECGEDNCKGSFVRQGPHGEPFNPWHAGAPTCHS